MRISDWSSDGALPISYRFGRPFDRAPRGVSRSPATSTFSRARPSVRSMAPSSDLADAPLLRAARGLPASRVPVWFMRQAGRSLPEYRAVRGEGRILDAIPDPDLSAELPPPPVRPYGLAPAIPLPHLLLPAPAHR